MSQNTQMSEEEMQDADPSAHLLDIFAKLHVSLDTIGTELRRNRDAERARLMNLPRSFMLPYQLPVNGSGQGSAVIGGPQPGREWIVREITAVDSSYLGTYSTGASASGAAGAANAVSLNGTGYINGFDVNIGPAATAGVATVTLSGVAGGPYTYLIDESTTNSETLSKSFNQLWINGTATLSISAVTGGGTTSLNLYGTQGPDSADLTWYVGQPVNNYGFGPLPAGMAFARMHGIPDEIKYTSDVVRVIQNQQIIVQCFNGTGNTTILGMAHILDQPAFAERYRVASQ